MKGFVLLSTRAGEAGLLLAGLIGTALARGAVADDHWDDRFNLPGIAFRGRALAVAGSLTYVGGSLRQAGEVAVTNIAVWDGSTFRMLWRSNGSERA